MNILSAQDLSKTYGEKILFRGITIGIDQSDRIGLIGINGSGKSTLLKILSGAECPDEGEVAIRQGLRIEYLPQNPVMREERTVLETIFASNYPEAVLVRDYEVACRRLEVDSTDEDALHSVDALSRKIEAAGAWDHEARAKAVLTRLGISNFEQKVEDLSGGFRKRVALARALVAEPDLLMLDEPTNHLDADLIEWLESFIHRFRGAILLVTHDRYFLDRITDRIFEIDERTIREYRGNFSLYLERKTELQEAQAKQEAGRKAILRKELAWLRRGARARTTKQKARIERVEGLKAVGPSPRPAPLSFRIEPPRMGTKTVELENLTKSFDGRVIVRDFSHTFKRGERTGIVGPNGCGKSTLANLISGRLMPDAGRIGVGDTVVFSYYDQESHDLNPSERAIDFVRREGGDVLRDTDGSELSATLVMRQFLFTGEMMYGPIEKLSGGERKRLYLVRTLMRNPNFLILDEPTNDLDIETLEALEDFLDGYPGILVVISHDRYFLDRNVDQVLVFEGEGRIRGYAGGYSDSAALRREEQEAKRLETSSRSPSKQPCAEKEKPRRLTYAEKLELGKLEQSIPLLEDDLKKIEAEMAASARDYGRLRELEAQSKTLRGKLDSAMTRWEYLAILAEMEG